MIAAAMAAITTLSVHATGFGTDPKGVASDDMLVETEISKLIEIKYLPETVTISTSGAPSDDFYTEDARFAVNMSGLDNEKAPFELTISPQTGSTEGDSFLLTNDNSESITLTIMAKDDEGTGFTEMSPRVGSTFETRYLMGSDKYNMSVKLKISTDDVRAAKEGKYSETFTFKVAAR